MPTLDPEVRDLLTAIHDGLERPDRNRQAPYTVRSAIHAVLRHPLSSPPGDVAAWVRDQTVEAADAGRVRDADLRALYEQEGQ